MGEHIENIKKKLALAEKYEDWEIGQEEWIELLEAFMPSKTMREYLKDEKIEAHFIWRLINASPVSIFTKEKWMKRLSFNEMAAEYESATDALKLKPGEFFYLKEFWFDDELLDEKEGSTGAFGSLEKVKEYIRFDLGLVNDEVFRTFTNSIAGKDWLCWYELEKWEPMENGEYANLYTYYLFRDEVLYFENNEYDSEIMGWRGEKGFFFDSYFSLPIPFKPGDVVILDSTPYIPATIAVILDKLDTVLSKDLRGKWISGDLYSQSLFLDYGWRRVSYLYRLEYFTEELPAEYKLLKQVSEYVKSGEKNAEIIKEKTHCRLTDEEEIVEVMEEHGYL